MFGFGEKFSTSRTKLPLEAKASICSTIKESLLLFCCKFPAFIFVIIMIARGILIDQNQPTRGKGRELTALLMRHPEGCPRHTNLPEDDG